MQIICFKKFNKMQLPLKTQFFQPTEKLQFSFVISFTKRNRGLKNQENFRIDPLFIDDKAQLYMETFYIYSELYD